MNNEINNVWLELEELSILRERRKKLRRSICRFIRVNYVTKLNSYDRIQRKIRGGWLGDYTDKRLIKISRDILIGKGERIGE